MAHYVDGFMIAVPKKELARYKKLATAASKVWMDHGALQYMECAGDDLEHEGIAYPFPKAAKCKPGDTVVFSWIVYRNRKHRDQVNKKVMADPRMDKMYHEQMKTPIFDHKRMAYGGFVAVVEFDPATGTTGQHFHTLVNPGYPIPAECTAIHGISDQDVAGAPKFKDVLPQLAAFLDGTACVIDNANYDTALLTAELQRLKKNAFGNMVCVVIDTLKIARQVLPGRKHKLDSLCDHYSVDRSARSVHGALIDCVLLAAIYPHLRGNLEELA